ncbi:hypothetical protein AAIE21_24235, partial [Paenibacillus sp. 102]|uniref:hypothetical protein n=1 Tax=Paenibacillus sp. 102 TaxID=3120823 RepID=UPI0031BB4575
TRQGLFDMPTFIKSIKDNNKLYEKTAFCMKIYLKLMDVGWYPIAHQPKILKYPLNGNFFVF